MLRVARVHGRIVHCDERMREIHGGAPPAEGTILSREHEHTRARGGAVGHKEAAPRVIEDITVRRCYRPGRRTWGWRNGHNQWIGHGGTGNRIHTRQACAIV